MNIFQLEERLNENPDSPLSARLAGQYLIRGKITSAVSLSLRCIEQNPDYATAYVILGRCYAALNSYKEAILCARKAFSIQPDSGILKNLLMNWEKLSLQENSQPRSESSPEIPDFHTLNGILFKELSLPTTLKVEEDNVQTIVEEEKEESLLVELETPSGFGIDENMPLQQSEENVALADETTPEQEHIVVEFVEQNDSNLPPAIESVLQSIDFESSTESDSNNQQPVTTFENDVEVKSPELVGQHNDAFVEQSEENLTADEFKTETEILEQKAKEENFNEQNFEEHKIEEISEIIARESSEKSELTENKTAISGGIDAGIIEEKTKDFNVITESTKVFEVLSESEDVKNISTEQEIISDSNLKEDNSKKSDEHIAKIFESAHETKKKEHFLDNVDFNHGPVPELPQIVSVTLAEIYVRQGEYEEAIKTYRALIQLRPKQKELFEKKIEELERKLKSQI